MEKKLQLYRGCRGYMKWVVVKNYGPFLDPNYNKAPNI